MSCIFSVAMSKPKLTRWLNFDFAKKNAAKGRLKKPTHRSTLGDQVFMAKKGLVRTQWRVGGSYDSATAKCFKCWHLGKNDSRNSPEIVQKRTGDEQRISKVKHLIIVCNLLLANQKSRHNSEARKINPSIPKPMLK